MQGVLFASFGTSHADAQACCLDAVCDALGEGFDGAGVYQAYTSGIIRRVLARRGAPVDDVARAMARMALDGVTDLVVQPGHLLPGGEYDKLLSQVAGCASLFDSVRVGLPLVNCSEDLNRLVDLMAEEFAAEKDGAVVLMGHGTDRFANVAYAAMAFRAQLVGRPDLLVATVEGEPTFDEIMAVLAKGNYRRVRLSPLMLVAGDHAKNDMAGDDPDSWASRLTAAGYEVEVNLRGLGQLSSVRQMYVEHAHDARELGK